MPREGLIELSLAEALLDPGHLGHQVGAPGRELAELGHRGNLLIFCRAVPACEAPGCARKANDEDPVSLRALIDHAFEYCRCPLASRGPGPRFHLDVVPVDRVGERTYGQALQPSAAAAIVDDVGRSQALDMLTLASMLHRRLDDAVVR